MNKNILAIGIIFLFVVSVLSPISNGYGVKTSIIKNETLNFKNNNYNNLIKQAIKSGVISNNSWIEQDKLLASDGAESDWFGSSVSMDGDTALIGKPKDDDNGHWSGSAYVFIRSGTNWTEQTKLLASDGAESDWFGSSVSINGDTALIGATSDNDNGTGSGSAYVFIRSGTNWTEQTKLLASDGAEYDYFGHSVSIDGNTALISTINDDDNGYNSGSAYIFTRSGTAWTQQAKLLPSDGDTSDKFGESVSIDGDTALIGAFLDDDNGNYSGSAYIFTRNSTVWTEQEKLLASDGAESDWFGSSVSIDGDYAIIGAFIDDDNGYNSGSAYIFKRTCCGWFEQEKLLASDGATDDSFGVSVSIDGDTALIGAYGDGDNGYFSGSTYIFTRSSTTWTQKAKLLASDGEESDHFGRSVSIDGDTALIGTPYDDDYGNESGSAYIFTMEGENQPPNNPIIDGPNSGKPGISYNFIFNAVDPDGDDIRYIIKWDDETKIITDFNTSGNDITLSHKWTEVGMYRINVKAEDKFGSVGPETTKTVTIQKNKTINSLFLLRFLEKFPLFEKMFLYLID